MKKSNKHKNNLKARVRTFAMPALIVVQLIAIGVLAFYANFTRHELAAFGAMRLGNQVIGSIDGMSKDVNVEPQTGKVYIPEVKLTLPPANSAEFKLRYYHFPESTGQESELRLIDTFSLNQAKPRINNAQNLEQVFDAVPRLQACARGYLVVFNERKKTDIPKAFHKQLKDGRTAYVYLENECSENKGNMLPYLQQLESY